MQPLDLNLASRPFRNNTLLWIGYLLAFVLLAGFTAWNVVSYRDHVEQLDSLRDQIDELARMDRDLRQRDRDAVAAIEKVDLDLLDIQADKANEVIDWKAFSWTRFFNLMEELQPWEVKMTSIRPLFRSRQARARQATAQTRRYMPVTVEGIAKSFKGFSELEQVLQDDSNFGRIEPERIRRLETGELGFQLQFNYFPKIRPAVEPPADEPSVPAEDGEAGAEEAPQAAPEQQAPPGEATPERAEGDEAEELARNDAPPAGASGGAS